MKRLSDHYIPDQIMTIAAAAAGTAGKCENVE